MVSNFYVLKECINKLNPKNRKIEMTAIVHLKTFMVKKNVLDTLSIF